MSAPFGIEIHGSVDQVEVILDLGGGKLQITPPKPHPQFSECYIQHHSSFGVVWIKGVSPSVANDSYGRSTRSAVEKLSGQLDTRYGSPRKVDISDPNGLWNDPRDWLMSLLQNERSFFHIWEQGKGARLPEDLANIFVGIIPYDACTSAVMIEYASTNFDAAEQAADENLADLL